jgi:circadian clock protein KaiC
MMAQDKRVQDPAEGRGLIESLATDTPGLDAVLGGGLPEFSFNLIAGGPGSGKSTLAQQIVFGAVRAGRKALYFTVLGEPTLKMLRYQSQFSFFDRAQVGAGVEFLNLSSEALQSGPERILERIEAEVARARPAVVVVDSFRSIDRAQGGRAGPGMQLDHFVQQLAVQLTTWEVTSFLIGEYDEGERPNPVFTVADGVLWLSQVADRNSVVRKLQVTKMRGRAPMPGLHTFRITGDGVEIFPRIPTQQFARRVPEVARQATGVPGLDELMGGGIPLGDVLMIAGPAGSGKTTFATQFVGEGGRHGQPAVVAVFEEYPEEYIARGRAHGLEEMAASGLLRMIYLRPLDLSVDETLAEILRAVEEVGAQRVVIDSLSGFEVALAPAFREDFRESLYRLVGALTSAGVTVLLTAEVVSSYPDMRLTSDKVSFITDDVIAQRYVEIGGRIQKVLTVVKMRGSAHSNDFRTYEVGAAGAVVGGPLPDYHGIITGTPDLVLRAGRRGYAGLTDAEGAVLDTLIRLGGVASDVLATRMGLPAAAIGSALARLLALGYVVEDSGEEQIVRAVAR